MNIESILNEVKEFARECVQKYKEECLSTSDSTIENYLKMLMPERDFEVFQHYKKLMIEEFRKSSREELEFLNS